jgi:hypothetical protein
MVTKKIKKYFLKDVGYFIYCNHAAALAFLTLLQIDFL